MKSTAPKGAITSTPVTGVVEPKETVKVDVVMRHSTVGHTKAGKKQIKPFESVIIALYM